MAMPLAAAAAIAAAVAIFHPGRECGETGVRRLHLAPQPAEAAVAGFADALEFGADLATADDGEPDAGAPRFSVIFFFPSGAFRGLWWWWLGQVPRSELDRVLGQGATATHTPRNGLVGSGATCERFWIAARDRAHALVREAAGRRRSWLITLSPIDLIPDFVPVLGYLDDLILLPLGILLSRAFGAEAADAGSIGRPQHGSKKDRPARQGWL